MFLVIERLVSKKSVVQFGWRGETRKGNRADPLSCDKGQLSKCCLCCLFMVEILPFNQLTCLIVGCCILYSKFTSWPLGCLLFFQAVKDIIQTILFWTDLLTWPEKNQVMTRHLSFTITKFAPWVQVISMIMKAFRVAGNMLLITSFLSRRMAQPSQ